MSSEPGDGDNLEAEGLTLNARVGVSQTKCVPGGERVSPDSCTTPTVPPPACTSLDNTANACHAARVPMPSACRLRSGNDQAEEIQDDPLFFDTEPAEDSQQLTFDVVLNF